MKLNLFMKTEKLCPHCDPYLSKSGHLAEKIENLLYPIKNFFYPLEWILQNYQWIHRLFNIVITSNFFKVLLFFNILQEVEINDLDETLHNRSLVVIKEARKRGITIKGIKILGKKSTNFFSWIINNNKKIFEGLPYFTVDKVLPIDFDDKKKLKNLLPKENFPPPRGNVFRDYYLALRYVKETLGFPVVVKPRNGSLSKHTTCDIKTESEFKEAVRIVKIISGDFIVEEFIEGNVYRITAVNGNVVAACRREPPNIIGDGKHIISELIELKNKNPLRGEIHQKNYTLHKIIISEKTKFLLIQQKLRLDSVLPKGKKIYLHDKVVLACGADIHDVTDIIHLDNIMLFKKIQEICKASLVGIDFIAQDISKPYYRQRCAIIEANSLPYIDMHYYPITGKERNIAAHILDSFA